MHRVNNRQFVAMETRNFVISELQSHRYITFSICIEGSYGAVNISGCVVPNRRINNSVALVRKRTIPTERPPLVGEVSANVCW
jgi:hypothetical protein